VKIAEYGIFMKQLKAGKNVSKASLEEQKIELIKLRIKNKYYDKNEALQKVVQEIYEHNIRLNN
jgi:hypothetical protein